MPAVAFASNFPYNNRRAYTIARDYVTNVCAAVQPGGMLLTLDWQVYSPFFYLHELENFRKDAVVIDINRLRRSWYFDYLRRAYPETMKQAQREADAFLDDLRAWESDPELYQREETLNRRISQRYQDLIMALVGCQRDRSAPVYVTQDIATYPEGGTESAWVRLVTGRYQFVPRGACLQAL